MSKFNNKTILVTGASSGIGLAMAKDFASRGANLILTARSKDKLEQLAKELEAQGTKTKVWINDGFYWPKKTTRINKKKYWW